MIKVIVCGACGRMGSAVTDLIAVQSDMVLAGGVEAFGHANVGMPLGKGMIVADLKTVIGLADVIVDFSLPIGSLENLRIAAAHSSGAPVSEIPAAGNLQSAIRNSQQSKIQNPKSKICCVLGTTGFNAPEQEEIKILSRSVPLVMAPNFSVGVNVLYRLTEETAKLLGADYDIEIVEFHHRRKKDAPSGTARQLARVAMQTSGRSRLVHGREGQVGEKPKDEIGVTSVRSGDIVGEHYVIFGTEGERVELVHKASSRLALAQGVLRAIRFIVGKPVGVYSMADVLGL
jgi:4-hydroxy-tetrahydrodipicolinate reductase